MSDLREYVKDRLVRYPGVTCALHNDLRHWLMEHPERPSDPMTADLRAGIEARLAEWRDEPLMPMDVDAIRAGRCGPIYYGNPCWLMPGHRGPHHCYREDIDALLAAHPVQDEATARAAFQEGYEFALIHLDDEPVQADLARLRPDRPVSAPGSRGNGPQEPANPGQVSQGRGRQNDAGGTSGQECGDVSIRGLVCQRQSGHDGAHMQFDSNGTHAWGG